MPESDEHKFLSGRTIDLLSDMSQAGLYGFKESDRKKFDFTCNLVRDWSRLISGQTLWKHSEGIDKDLRMLLADEESKVTLYVARDTMKNRRVVQEIVDDTKRTPMRPRLDRLRTIWVTSDFDSDLEDHRDMVSGILKERLTKDLLLSVILGGISARDFQEVVARSGIPGLNLAVIEAIGRDGFFNMPDLAKRLSLSPTTVRNRVHILSASGLLDKPKMHAQMYAVSTKGKVILDVCRSLALAAEPENGLTSELIYVLEVLGFEFTDEPIPLGLESLAGFDEGPSPRGLFKDLVIQSVQATENFGIDWQGPFFELGDREGSHSLN
ncbi:MarR family transcriptional regulator [Streptomyces sp. NPDC056987]|uniref:MarR family transcriptional regulator n=1 Tax=Streptomyces sp. NPDC056987 TaxID=3345988 RepID=UPI003631ACA8